MSNSSVLHSPARLLRLALLVDSDGDTQADQGDRRNSHRYKASMVAHRPRR